MKGTGGAACPSALPEAVLVLPLPLAAGSPVFSQRTFIGTPFLRLRFSVLITNGLRACRIWRTGSCARRHIVPHGPAQPSQVAKFAKKVPEVVVLAPALAVVRM